MKLHRPLLTDKRLTYAFDASINGRKIESIDSVASSSVFRFPGKAYSLVLQAVVGDADNIQFSKLLTEITLGCCYIHSAMVDPENHYASMFVHPERFHREIGLLALDINLEDALNSISAVRSHVIYQAHRDGYGAYVSRYEGLGWIAECSMETERAFSNGEKDKCVTELLGLAKTLSWLHGSLVPISEIY